MQDLEWQKANNPSHREYPGNRKLLRAEYLGTLKGRRVYRVPVHVETVDTQSRDFHTESLITDVTAHNAADAADYVHERLAGIPNRTITAYGPRYGTVRRFAGYETAIGEEMAKGSIVDLLI
jgi:hypothetical protein